MKTPQETRELILDLAEKKGVSINKMLQECSLNKSVVDRLKQGSKPSADTMTKIANYLDVTVNYLLGVDEPTHLNQVQLTPPPDKVAISVIGYGRKQETKYITKEKYDKFKATLDMLCDED